MPEQLRYRRSSAATSTGSSANLVPVSRTSEPAPANRRLCFRATLFDVDLPALHVFAIHFFDGISGLVSDGHYDECKSSRCARGLIHGDGHRSDLAATLENATQVVSGCLARQVSHKDFDFAS